MAAWHGTIPMRTPLAISVNASFEYLTDHRLIPDLQHILAETGLDPGFLRLEMPENSIILHGETANGTLRQLKAMRIGLEVDDFGTGQASLGYLRKLPFDTLKIDRSFVKELGTINDSSAIISTILTFVNSVGMQVVAEGVETQDQFNRLTALGCCRAQGYYFSKPMNSAGAEALIRDEINGSGLDSSIHLV
jgi:EAL domain-containing protein (putative c-di-GMP-specific phosphodiesterase class I)